jgi:beta-glucosidase-like glycosyl hydrolase
MFFCNNKVATRAKHFVGDGGTRKGINENYIVISYDGLVSIHMRPYFDAPPKAYHQLWLPTTVGMG